LLLLNVPWVQLFELSSVDEHITAVVLVVFEKALLVGGSHVPANVILVGRVVGSQVFLADHVGVVTPEIKALNR
jgi:hypothetical protein